MSKVNFTDFYLQEKKMSIGRRIKNLFTSVKVYDLNVDKLKSFREISERGYQVVVDKLSDVVEIEDWRKKKAARLDLDKNDERLRKDYLKRYKLKSDDRVTQIYRGNLTGSNSKLEANFEPLDVSVYQTNQNGIVSLISMEKSNELDEKKYRYYVGSDGKGDKFFKSVLGMSIDTFATLYKPDKKRRIYDFIIPKEKEPEEDKPVEKQYRSYLEKIEDNIQNLRDDNRKWFAFIRLNQDEYYNIIDRIKSLNKKSSPFRTDYLGNINKFSLNDEEIIYTISNAKEFYIIYETPQKEFINNIKEIINNDVEWYDIKDNIHWYKNLNITILPKI